MEDSGSDNTAKAENGEEGSDSPYHHAVAISSSDICGGSSEPKHTQQQYYDDGTQLLQKSESKSTTRQKRPYLTVVCVADTHGEHERVSVPAGQVLVVAGDYTRYGREEHARNLNEWLGRQPHAHKIVVQGNHEANASWKERAREILSNAILLINESVEVEGYSFHGTQFYWPMKSGENNPCFGLIEPGTDVVIAHGPAAGRVDGNHGCESLRAHCERVNAKLVISGHIHHAHGHTSDRNGRLWVNAACCGKHHGEIKNAATVIQLGDDRTLIIK